LFVGNVSAKSTKNIDSYSEAKVIKYQPRVEKSAKNFNYYQYFSNLNVGDSAPKYIIKLSCWLECKNDIPLKEPSAITPIKRGPPHCAYC
jgi:ABC-type xylose transport system substrate-binding protein